MKKKVFVFILCMLITFLFSETERDILKIYFYPMKFFVPNNEHIESILIYDNYNQDFSDLLIKNILKAPKAIFYVPCKDKCEEGWYKIIIEKENNKYEFEVSDKSVVYDINNNSYLKFDCLSIIYEYLANEKLKDMFNQN